MGIVHLPVGRGRGEIERAALQRGLAAGASVQPLHVLATGGRASAYCAGCAAPIEFGAVTRGIDSFCSVECSLGGGRPA
jgi:hypothetical protein